MNSYITYNAIDVASLVSQKIDSRCGANSIFIGYVRNKNNNKLVEALHYECYESMANKIIFEVIKEVSFQHRLENVIVRHRIGDLVIGEVAIFISATSPHRDTAFLGTRQILEEIKNRVPVWKKEIYQNDVAEWVNPIRKSIDNVA